MARLKTNLLHFDDQGTRHEVTKDKKTGDLYIKGTNTVVTKVCRKNNNRRTYDFRKPAMAQNLGSEWDDYPWSANDF